MRRVEHRQAQKTFLNDPQTQALLATDAAGEDINLQCTHLMVNYDLPWNPEPLGVRRSQSVSSPTHDHATRSPSAYSTGLHCFAGQAGDGRIAGHQSVQPPAP